jgi:CSLREA domain-containing protein
MRRTSGARAVRAMLAVVLASVALPLLAAGRAEAVTTINVTTANDVVNAGDGLTSLREAVSLANFVGGNAVIQLSASATLSKCDGAGDDDTNFGGDLDYSGAGPLTIHATAAGVVISGQTTCGVVDDRILDVHSAATVTIDSAVPGSPITLQHGAIAGNGGAARSLGAVVVTNGTVASNTATGNGAGIDAASVTLTDALVNDNSSSAGDGGGVHATGAVSLTRTTVRSNTANNGGGIYAVGALTIATSTLTTNTARTSGGGATGTGGVTLNNSTIWFNTAVDSSTVGVHRGGGIDAPAGTVSLTFSTIALNRGLLGGANLAASGTLSSFASIVGAAYASSTGPSCVVGATASTGYNLDDTATCGFGSGAGDASNVKNVLGYFGPQGGSTSTAAPMPGSVAIDRVPAATSGCSGTDQRGVARPQGTGCDSGAFEANGPITVTTTADGVNPVDGLLSLREAVNQANAAFGPDTIVLAAGATYPITFCGTESFNAAGSFDTRDLAGTTFKGSATTINHTCVGAQDAVVYGGGVGLVMEGVTVDHSPGVGIGFGVTGFGGLIDLKDVQILNSGTDGLASGFNTSSTTLRNVKIKNSNGQGVSLGSGVSTFDMADSEITGSKKVVQPNLIGGAGEVGNANIRSSSIHDNPGGGLFVTGTLTTTDSHYDNNTGGLPAVFARGIVATDTTFDNNVGVNIGAGGLFVDGSATLTRVSISGNKAATDGGVVFTSGYSFGPASVVSIVDSHIDNNTMTGPGTATQTDAGGIYYRGATAGGSLTISGSTINGNSAPGWSAIYTDRPLTLTNSTVSGNTATTSPPSTINEATVFVYNAAATVRRSTISGNTAPLGTAVGTGGLFVYGNTTLEDSTVTGNTGRFGGLVLNGGGWIRNSTIVANTGGASGVANLTSDGAMPLTIAGSVLATPLGSTANCYFFTPSVTSSGYNFDSGTTCGFAATGDVSNGGDPLLAPLADNGGPTKTMLPLPGSPLANRILTTSGVCWATDQRGVARPQGPACDIGAVEGDDGDVVWARSAGGTGSDLSRDVEVDASGNSYVVGTITGSATFGSGPSAVTLVTQGAKDGFLAKYAPDGSLLWAKRLGGSSSDEAWGLAVDLSGNPIVTGVFDGTVAFGVLGIVNGTNDMFVAKYSPAGVLTWVRSASGSDWEQGLSVSTDNAGNVFVGGVAASPTTTFGTGTGQTITNQGSLDGFVARYGPGGGLWWVNTIAGPGQDFLTGVAARPDGSVAVIGTMEQPARFGVGGSLIAGYGGNDAFVAVFNGGGATNWAIPIGGAGSDIGWGIASEVAGDLYVTGAYSGTVTAGGFNATSLGSTDVFVAKVAGTGSVLWLRSAGGTNPDFGLGVTVNGSDVFLTGAVMGSGPFGPFVVGSSSALAPADGFIARLSTSGTWMWAQKLVSGPGTDYGLAVAANASGVWAVGNFVGPTATIGQGGGTIAVTGAGSDDLFVTRFNR